MDSADHRMHVSTGKQFVGDTPLVSPFTATMHFGRQFFFFRSSFSPLFYNVHSCQRQKGSRCMLNEHKSLVLITFCGSTVGLYSDTQCRRMPRWSSWRKIQIFHRLRLGVWRYGVLTAANGPTVVDRLHGLESYLNIYKVHTCAKSTITKESRSPQGVQCVGSTYDGRANHFIDLFGMNDTRTAVTRLKCACKRFLHIDCVSVYAIAKRRWSRCSASCVFHPISADRI